MKKKQTSYAAFLSPFRATPAQYRALPAPARFVFLIAFSPPHTALFLANVACWAVVLGYAG